MLTSRGASVALVGRTEASIAADCADLREGGTTCIPVVADVRDEEAMRLAVGRAVDELGTLHIAIACAGNEAESGFLEDLSVEDFTRIFDVHVRGTFLLMKYALPAIVASGGGALITTASTGGLVGFRGAPLYCAAKHAVVGMTKVAALDYAPRGVRVNCVAPSAIDTPMLARFIGERSGIREHLATAHPLGRISTAEEVAEGILWLASEQSRYVTGHTLVVDGGFTAS